MAVKRVTVCTDGLSATVQTFQEMKITSVAKFVGAMIGSDGYIHHWTVLRNKFVRAVG